MLECLNLRERTVLDLLVLVTFWDRTQMWHVVLTVDIHLHCLHF